MTFLEVLHGAEILKQQGDAQVTAIAYDSRKVSPGTLFVAMRGDTTDGNRFIDAAIAAGAVAVVTDDPAQQPRDGAAWAVVPHGRRALARISANFFGQPAQKMSLSGVTGTNGKTTTTFLLDSILQNAGRKTVLLGTIEYHVAGSVIPAPHTTPEALEVLRMLAQGREQGATEAVMEVSSHALAQERVFGLPFDVAVFTNLTRDHLDYHRDMEEYFAAKQMLFAGVGTDPPRVAVINKDDEYGDRLADSSRAWSKVCTYGLTDGDFNAKDVQIGPTGTRFQMVTPEGEVFIHSRLIGRVNVYNILAAGAAAWARGCSLEQIAAGVEALARVPGRFELVDAGQPFTLAVDYAHTDDALRNLTSVAREFVSRDGRKGRVITVFGCGGDRDRKKRPLMGEAAGRGSDVVVMTSDNPRSEDPLRIMLDALSGLQRSGARYTLEPDRRRAIDVALHIAQPGDIVLIAGKGHEKTQTTAQGVFPFDDVAVAREALRDHGYGDGAKRSRSA